MQWSRLGLAAFVAMVCLPELIAQQRRDRAESAADVAIELGFVDRLPSGQPQYSVAIRVGVGGAVSVPRDGDQRLTRSDQLNGEQLAGLLREIHQDGRLFATPSLALQQQIEQACQLAGFAVDVDGAAETVIRCRTDQGLEEIRCPALSVMAARFPDFPAIQRLHLTQLRLQNVAAVAKAGGEAATEQLAQMVNQSLHQSHPQLAPLTSRDLSMIRELRTGSRYVQFYRTPQRGQDELLVSLFQSPGTEPRVSVMLNPTRSIP
ncbi:MAG: hypothetical protein ACK5Q5_22320 [Planctomycetaceae bacterium]